MPSGPDQEGPGGRGLTYADAGVDIGAGDEAVERIKDVVRTTYRPEVIGDLGGFGGLFALATERYRQPLLVAATDGVGTKAQLASATGRLDTIGIDLVAMCVDDLVCQGAEPLFLLDYLATEQLDPGRAERVVTGIADGCRQAGCALIGGETAEHPGSLASDAFDLAGFAVGVVERDDLLGAARVGPGDVLVGLVSPGLRCNGYSLARRALLEVGGRSLDDPAYAGAAHSLADELLEPSVIYTPAVLALTREVGVRAVAHITGGGIAANLARVLPSGCDAVVERSAWRVPPIFGEIQRAGHVPDDEMDRVFNLGLGMVAVVAAEDAGRAVEVLQARGRRALAVGRILPGGAQRVHVEG
ncbi:MAG TPA: phosphoribosylformylglycinamidine cyclo-ligase [Acidimicrobiales bacterium]